MHFAKVTWLIIGCPTTGAVFYSIIGMSTITIDDAFVGCECDAAIGFQPGREIHDIQFRTFFQEKSFCRRSNPRCWIQYKWTDGHHVASVQYQLERESRWHRHKNSSPWTPKHHPLGRFWILEKRKASAIWNIWRKVLELAGKHFKLAMETCYSVSYLASEENFWPNQVVRYAPNCRFVFWKT